MTNDEQQQQREREGFREGIRAGIGVLAAMKEALEDTIKEMRERGDLSPERGREVMRDAMGRAQTAMGEARERFDLVPRRDFEVLRAEVAELTRRIEQLERGAGGPGIGTQGE